MSVTDVAALLYPVVGFVCGFVVARGVYKKGFKDLEAALDGERKLSTHKSWVIAELEALNQWRDGPAPGETWVLVKTKYRIKVAKLMNNPCVWFDDHDRVVPDVLAWRPLV